MALPEDGPLDDIEAFFADLHFELVLHDESPPEPTPDERRRMSSIERSATKRANHPHWVDLRSVDTGYLLRWYGGGETEETAMRRARARWRVEQG